MSKEGTVVNCRQGQGTLMLVGSEGYYCSKLLKKLMLVVMERGQMHSALVCVCTPERPISGYASIRFRPERWKKVP